MDHDELLEMVRINVVDKCPNRNAKGKCNWGCWICQLSMAMLGVLEIHYPKKSEYFSKEICDGCTLDIDFYEYYPCKTIQAIEEELR
jgi:hypothetical protein